MNSEFGIIYIPLVCNKNRRADSISDRQKPCILGKFSVGDGFPVPNREAIFSTYIIFRKQKEPVFKEFKIFENRFFYYETPCGAGRETRPLRKIGSCHKFAEQNNSEFRIPNSEFNNAYHALLIMYSAMFLGVTPSFSRSSSGL